MTVVTCVCPWHSLRVEIPEICYLNLLEGWDRMYLIYPHVQWWLSSLKALILIQAQRSRPPRVLTFHSDQEQAVMGSLCFLTGQFPSQNSPSLVLNPLNHAYAWDGLFSKTYIDDKYCTSKRCQLVKLQFHKRLDTVDHPMKNWGLWLLQHPALQSFHRIPIELPPWPLDASAHRGLPWQWCHTLLRPLHPTV